MSRLLDYPFPRKDHFALPEEFRQLRDERPVCEIQLATGDRAWLVTRYADVRDVLNDRRFSRNIFRPDAARLIPGVPTRQVSSPFVEPPVHTRWRKLVTRAFTPRHVETMRPGIQALVDELLDHAAGAAQPVDLMEHLAFPLSIGVLFSLLGIPEDRVTSWRDLAETALTMNDATMEAKERAFLQMNSFSDRLIEDKRSEAADDFLSHLVAVSDESTEQLSSEELSATVLAMLVGGYESATNQIGKTLLALFRFPEQLERLRAEPALIGSAVDEGLRFAALDSGFGSPRYATEDITVGGVTIPRGATVLAIRQSADRDERQYSDPEAFNITRPAGQHLGFGWGPHRCLGGALARLELEVGVGTVVTRFPNAHLAVTPEEVKWDYRITAAGPAVLPVALW